MRCDDKLVGRPRIGTLEARGGLPRSPAEGTNSDAELGMDWAIGDGVDERLMVNPILIGVRHGEVGDSPVESITRAEVGSDGDPVTGPGVSASETPAAHFRIDAERLGRHGLHVNRELPIQIWREVLVGTAHTPIRPGFAGGTSATNSVSLRTLIGSWVFN
jgi:hypothetical protein